MEDDKVPVHESEKGAHQRVGRPRRYERIDEKSA